MIQANELRVGNLIYSDGIVVTADARTIFDIWDSSKKYDPIQITPEWLERLGFKLVDDSGMTLEYNKRKITILFGTQRTPPILGDVLLGDDQDTYVNHIKYVHQLQNLYFALTGTELPVKP